MRSSYSMPSAFIAAIASPRARNSCWPRMARGSSSVDSTIEIMSSANAGSCARRRIRVEQLERGESERRQRLVQGEVRLQVDREADARRPAVCSTMPDSRSVR